MLPRRTCVVAILALAFVTTAVFLAIAPGAPTWWLSESNGDADGLCKVEVGEGQPATLTSSGEGAALAEDAEEVDEIPRQSMEQESLGSYHHMDGLFQGGDGHHHSYRIPSIVSAGGSRLIAFAEGRVHCAGDSGHIRLVYRTSDDGGGNWSSLRYLFGIDDSSNGTWGNPTAVFEKPWEGGPSLGRVHLFLNHNDHDFREFDFFFPGCPQSGKPWRPVQHGDRQTYYVFSDDAGETWSLRQNWTEQLLPKHLAWDAVGPGVGIKKLFEPNKSMLVVPAHSRNFISSDHGATWTSVLVTSNESQEILSEPTIAECADGRLYRNDRPGDLAFYYKSRSRWTLYLSRPDKPAADASAPDVDLPDPKSEGSLFSYAPDLLLFLNSDDNSSRTMMRVQLSTDCGKTWRIKRWLYESKDLGISVNAGGYSSMAKTGDFHVAALSEAWALNGVSIDLIRFDLNWLCQDKSFCRGASCTVSCRGLSDEGPYFQTPKTCIESAMGMELSADANPVVTKVQQRRKGELVWMGWVELWPLHRKGTFTGDCQGRPNAYKWGASWKKGDALLFPGLSA